jgi:hypothetical protein
MNKKFIILPIFIITLGFLHAQTKPADTVVIKVGEASKVTFEIRDQKDLQTLKQYDFQAVVNDLISKLEKRDTTITKSSDDYVKVVKDGDTLRKIETNEEEWDQSWRERDKNWKSRDRNVRYQNTSRGNNRYRYRSTFNSINFDLGLNNYLSDGKFPNASNNAYSVKPWGSWFVGVNSTQRTRLARVFFLEWGGGISWYNFKFQNERTSIVKTDVSTTFPEDTRDVDFKKSKLTAGYLNLSLVPMIDFGGNRRKGMFFDGRHSESIRFGAGPYAGYLINSYSKQVYKENGDKEKDRNHDNFYLNNIRYGVRFQFGFRDVDLFFNYDLNELFVENKGPKLNAFSFGITL